MSSEVRTVAMKGMLYIMGALVVGGTAFYSLFSSPRSNFSQDDEVVAAIQQLSAPDQKAREVAKERIVSIGAQAVHPLILFLDDLMTNPHNRYADGKTEQDFLEARNRLERIPVEEVDRRAEAVKELSGFLINQRLRNDTCELLGRLQAKEAIAILIKAMEYEPSESNWETMNAGMNALVQIGVPAVPKLIDALETAKERAASTPYAEGHPSEFFVNTEAAKYQARVSMVLGEIGEVSALPVLRTLENSTDSTWLVPYLRRAIAGIKNRQKGASAPSQQ